MSAEPTPIDQKAFEPYRGGLGITLTAITSASTSAAIPGMGVGEGKKGQRVMFTNRSKEFMVAVRMGGSTVEATTHCYTLVPGATQPLTAPFTPNAAVWFAVLGIDGEADVNAVAGETPAGI